MKHSRLPNDKPMLASSYKLTTPFGQHYGGHDPGVCAHNHAAITAWLLGYPDQAVAHVNDSVSLTEDLGQPVNSLVSHAFTSWLYQYRREPLLVREHAQSVITLCEERGLMPQHLFAARVLRGWASAATGQVADGIAEIGEGLRRIGASARRSYYLSILAQVYVWSGESENGLTALAEALEFADQTGERTWDAELHRLKGELLLLHSKDNSAEAADCFGTAIRIAHEQGAKSLELRAATSLASLWNDQDKRDEARALLSPVYDWFTEGFDTADLNEAKIVLDELA
jgi:adenylate cyclase